MKSGIKITFYRYLNGEGEHAAVEQLESEANESEETDEGELLPVPKHHDSDAQKQPLQLTGYEHGIYTGKVIGGTITLCKDEIHDLLNAEGRGLLALFVVALTDQ